LAALPSSWQAPWRKGGNDNKFSECRLGSRLGADEVVDYKNQEFENVLSGYDIVLGTVRGDTIEKSTQILKPGGKIISLIGPLDARSHGERHLNIFLRTVFGLMSRKIIRLAKNSGA
jgi:NADPH:quinone reductase-like Zn-dependent oxidoreductase